MFILALALLLSTTNAQQEGCTIDVTKLPPNSSLLQPLVLSNKFEFLYPSSNSSEIIIQVDDYITIACPGGQVVTDLPPTTLITAICNLDSELVVGETVLDFYSIGCSTKRMESTRATGKPCGGIDAAEIIEVGFEIGNNVKFLPLYELCYDKFYQYSLYASYTTSPVAKFQQNTFTVWDFDDGFYNLPVPAGQLYNTTRIIQTFANLTGFGVEEFFGVRGSFTQKILSNYDIIYKSQLNASFHFINSYPQWGLPSSNNWNSVETSENNYVKDRQVELQVFTGVYGVVAYEHAVTGEPVNLYLVFDQFKNPAIPLPALFWKILYNQELKQAVVVLSVNGNYAPNVQKHKDLCPEVSGAVSWLTWDNPTEPNSGYSYICSYPQAKKAISFLPELDVTDILY